MIPKDIKEINERMDELELRIRNFTERVEELHRRIIRHELENKEYKGKEDVTIIK
jgi:tetrahydromethanopterin S-methyltransferase subunit G